MKNYLDPEQVTELRRLVEINLTERDELFGENPDDAYDNGVLDGKAELAKEVLGWLGIKHE